MIRKFLNPIILCLLATPVFCQTYEVEEVNIVCEVKPIAKEFNTKNSEFAPYVYENTMFFTSSREYDLTHFGENNWKRAGYLNIFTADIKGEVDENAKIKDVHLLSRKIKADNHTGPMCLSITGDTLFYTQVTGTGTKKSKTKPQLYMAIKDGSSWDNIVKLPFNDSKFSFGHPSFDSKNKKLYFASDIKGGKGGKDIYYVELKNGQWSTPKNLSDINTEADELYPFVRGKTFFFSSNRGGGVGGLDVYWKETGSPDDTRLLEGLNSEGDDFGIFVYPGMTKGYFSSNRANPDDDDIYFLYMEKKVTLNKEMAGRFTYRNIDGEASDLQVQIFDENDKLLLETTTNENGEFVFKNIEYEGDFKVRPMTEEDMGLFLYNENGDPVTELLSDEYGDFTYKKLKGEDAGHLSLIPEDMIDLDLNEGHLSGQFVYENSPGKYPVGMNVKLRNKDGEVMVSTKTDEHGNFDFKKLSMEENYILHMDEVDEPLILLIYDKSGNVVAQMKTNENGDFVYRKLDPSYSNNLSRIDESEDMFSLESKTVAGQFQYKNLSAAHGEGLSVMAYGEDGILLDEVETDEDGYFRFRSLPPSTNLLFKVDESDPDMQMDEFTLYIFDRNGKKVAKLRRGQDGFFIFKPLGYEESTLSKLSDSINFNLKSKMKLVTVYYGSNQERVKSSDITELNKLAKVLKAKSDLKIEINAYADARSSDEYNLVLSQKRGDWVVRYLTRKGLDPKRFVVNAYGESRLVDEDKHALNRRAEIRVY